MANKKFFLAFSQGDSVTSESTIWMAVAPTADRAKELFFELLKTVFAKISVARQIAYGNICDSLSPQQLNFVSRIDYSSEGAWEQYKKEVWQKTIALIESTTLDNETAIEVFSDFVHIA